MQNRLESGKIKHPEEKVFWIVGLGFMVMVAAPAAYIIVFFDYEVGGPGEWGTFATYFSGIVTPVVALCSALLFYRSIIVQRDEFDKTRREMQEATEVQRKAELNRINIIKQEQIEVTIPKAFASQKKSKTSALNNFNRLNSFGYDPISMTVANGRLSSNLSENTPSEDELSKVIVPLNNYCKIGNHLVYMINEYFNYGGDVYIQLDTIFQMHAELTDIRSKLEALDVDALDAVAEYRKNIRQLRARSQLEMANYANRAKEPQSA